MSKSTELVIGRKEWRDRARHALYTLFPDTDYEIKFSAVRPHDPGVFPNQLSGRVYELWPETPRNIRFIAIGQDGSNALIFIKHYAWLMKNTTRSNRKHNVIIWMKKDGTDHVAWADDEALRNLYGSCNARGGINGEEYMILRPKLFCEVKEAFVDHRLLQSSEKNGPVQLDLLSDIDEIGVYEEKFPTWPALCSRYNVANMYARTKNPNAKTVLTVMQQIGGTHKFSGLIAISPNRHEDGYIAIHTSKPKK